MRKRHTRPEDGYQRAVSQAIQKGAKDHRFIGSVVDNQIACREEEPLKIRVTPIAWGIPMDEVGYSKFWVLFYRHCRPMPWDTFLTTESTYLPRARNQIHDMYLKTDSPFLMMLDSDIMVPPDLIDVLISHNKPIMGGWYKNKNRLKIHTPHPIVYDYVSTGEDGTVNWRHREEPGTGLEKVDGMGAGCWLMKREVAESLGMSPYDMMGGTEDLKLSRKLMNLNIPMYVDWNLACAHIGVSWV